MPRDYVDKFGPEVSKNPKRRAQYRRKRLEAKNIELFHDAFNKRHFGVPEE